MKTILLKVLPALIIGIAMIVSALIFGQGMNDLANGLYNISYAMQNAVDSKLYQTVQDFPSHLTVELWNASPLDVDISGSIKTKESSFLP